MSIGGIGGLVNPTTIGVVSSALSEVAEGINTRGSVGIAEAENAFQNFSQQEIAGFDPSQRLVVNDPAFYPSPAEAYQRMLKSSDANSFSNIVNPLEVNRFMSDPQFKSAEALTSCSNNLLGGKGVTDNLIGKDGLLSSMLGGVQLKVEQRIDAGGISAGIDIKPDMPTGGSERASINIKDPDIAGVKERSVFNPNDFAVGSPDTRPTDVGQVSIGGPVDTPQLLSRMDSFDGLLNLDPYSTEGRSTLQLFNEQLRALNGFEGVVKEQVALNQQLQNFQNFQGKILG